MKKYLQVFLFVVVLGGFILPTFVLAVDGWTPQTTAGSRDWISVTSSSDGTKLAAVVYGGYIYTSTDSGVNWTEQTEAGSRYWISITSSSDGTKLAAGSSSGYIYTSTDSGVNWTGQTEAGSRTWNSITSSSDGTKLAASTNEYIYTSTDSGVNWTGQTEAGSRTWYSITSSSDGTKLAAGAYNGYIYTSTDSGVNWTQQTGAGSREWRSITSSSDGTKLAASTDEYIYTSTDSGVNWTEQTEAGSRAWYSITSSSDGIKLVAGAYNGYIYTYGPVTVVPPTLTTSEASSLLATSATLNGEITDTGYEDATQHGFAYGTSADLSTVIATTTLGTKSGTGTFTSDITGLTEGTTYYVRAYATNSSGTGYGTIETFVIGYITPPTLTTSEASSLLATSATLNGEITDTGYEDATQHGFAYGTSADLSTVIATTTLGTKSGTGAFTSDIIGLTEGTTYYVRAYATNSSGTGYGSIETFDTAAIVPSTLTTSAASSVLPTSATLNGEITDIGYEDATQHGFAYGTSADLSTVIATTTLGTKSGTGAFTSDITGLTEDTTYYVRAYATNSSGTGYGSIQTFATPSIVYISNCTELQAMSDDLDDNYILSGNIDCSDTVNWNSGEGFVPVGRPGDPFTGTLDGAGYTISNLIINRPVEYNVGLFGYADSITVQDLTITGSIEGSGTIGALAGRTNIGSISISNIHIEVDVIGSNSYIGGIVGDAEGDSISITDSSMTGSVVVDGLNADSIGGLVGYIYASDATIDSSFNTGSITVVTEDYAYYGIGGLVGYNDDVLDISNSYNTGDISVTAGTYTEYGIGGLVGYYYYAGTISNSYNIGDISVTSGTYSSDIGGLFGYADDDTIITNSFSQGNININSGSTVSYVGGLLGYWDYDTFSMDNSYAYGNISVTSISTSTFIGGLVGEFDGSEASITNSFAIMTLDITNPNRVSGLIGYDNVGATLSNNFYQYDGTNECMDGSDPEGCDPIVIPSYFLSNSTSEPMASWNFSTIWSTVTGKLPILTSLASPYTTVTTSSASSVTKTGAVLNATISTLSGGSSATVRGFAWGTSSTYSATTTSSGSFSTGAFTTTLSDLTCNTTYHFRAYATNPSTTGFGDDATFTTSACATASSGGGGGGGGSGSRARVVLSPIATTTPTTIQIPKLLLNLKLGDSNPEVTTLQTILVSLGFLKVSPTGYFGPLTESALKAYQVSKGLPPVGVVGPLTRASLNSLTLNSQTVTPPTNPIPPATTTPSIYTRNLDIGSTGDDVRALQSFLTSKGYTVPSTGYFGPLTQSALAKFQKDNGISPAVGYFGPVTRGRVR